MSMPSERLEKLLRQNKLTGIDFIYVHKDLVQFDSPEKDHVRLDVHFHVSPDSLVVPLVDDLAWEDLTIVKLDGPLARLVKSLGWSGEDGRKYLTIITSLPSGLTDHRLNINDRKERIDRHFNDVLFSFQAACPTELDCWPEDHECPDEPRAKIPIEYRARDFWSMRRALLDFASLRYPHWQDNGLEADVGTMLLEVMCALGDEMSYYQDRVGREAHFSTATQRRSMRHHARLVDYALDDGLGSSTWLSVKVQDGQEGILTPGLPVWSRSDGGKKVFFETGKGLAEKVEIERNLREKNDEYLYWISHSRNSLLPHIWDESETCLPAGSTHLYIQDKCEEVLWWNRDEIVDPWKKALWVLIQTEPVDPAIPERKWVVPLTGVNEVEDVLNNQWTTRLTWNREYATPFEMDLSTMNISANLIPVAAGKTWESKIVIGTVPETASIPDEDRENYISVVERQGPDNSLTYLFTLPDADREGLVWLDVNRWQGSRLTDVRPEILLEELDPNGDALENERWHWRRSFIGAPSSSPSAVPQEDQRFPSDKTNTHFTLDDGTWRHVAEFRHKEENISHIDYATGDGMSIRFGDGRNFGRKPERGTLFQVLYRLGNGTKSNVKANTIRSFDEKYSLSQLDGSSLEARHLIKEINNPLPSFTATDPETFEQIRQNAPHAFRELLMRAVLEEDYSEAAERLDWIQKAGTSFRWTGSWLAAFTTPDPRGAAGMTENQRFDLHDQIGRFRQTGREAYVMDPRYVDLDLRITVCVDPSAYRGEVKEKIFETLIGEKHNNGHGAFFSPDNFTFGTPLLRSNLEAKILDVKGVRAVMAISVRRRGSFDWSELNDLKLDVGVNELIRIENDPDHPEWGTVNLFMEGGA